MKKIYDWDAKPCERNHTVADLKARKGKNIGVLSQTTANTEEEAKAASEVGIDLLLCDAENTKVTRENAPTLFLTAALALPNYPTQNDVLRGAFKAMKAGADSIYTTRGPHIVELLAREDIPVMCHLGFDSRKSTWQGGLKANGRDVYEANALMQNMCDMEAAGAFLVNAECIVSEVMTWINKRTELLTCSLGSGIDADIIYLFQNDICGEQEQMPRHAKAFGSIQFIKNENRRLLKDGVQIDEGQRIRDERLRALKAYKDAVKSKTFPENANIVNMSEFELPKLQQSIYQEKKRRQDDAKGE